MELERNRPYKPSSTICCYCFRIKMCVSKTAASVLCCARKIHILFLIDGNSWTMSRKRKKYIRKIRGNGEAVEATRATALCLCDIKWGKFIENDEFVWKRPICCAPNEKLCASLLKNVVEWNENTQLTVGRGIDLARTSQIPSQFKKIYRIQFWTKRATLCRLFNKYKKHIEK